GTYRVADPADNVQLSIYAFLESREDDAIEEVTVQILSPHFDFQSFTYSRDELDRLYRWRPKASPAERAKITEAISEALSTPQTPPQNAPEPILAHLSFPLSRLSRGISEPFRFVKIGLRLRVVSLFEIRSATVDVRKGIIWVHSDRRAELADCL